MSGLFDDATPFVRLSPKCQALPPLIYKCQAPGHDYN